MLFFGGGMQSPRRRSREKAIFITIFIVFALYFLFFANSSARRQAAAVHEGVASQGGPNRDSRSGQATPLRQPQRVEKDLVVASMKKDDVSWLFEFFPDWHKSVYVVNDPEAELTVKLNKGRESMVYLT